MAGNNKFLLDMVPIHFAAFLSLCRPVKDRQEMVGCSLRTTLNGELSAKMLRETNSCCEMSDRTSVDQWDSCTPAQQERWRATASEAETSIKCVLTRSSSQLDKSEASEPSEPLSAKASSSQGYGGVEAMLSELTAVQQSMKEPGTRALEPLPVGHTDYVQLGDVLHSKRDSSGGGDAASGGAPGESPVQLGGACWELIIRIMQPSPYTYVIMCTRH